MKKIISLMIMLALIMSMGMAAFADVLEDNQQGSVLDTIDAGDQMTNNYGTVMVNNGDLHINHHVVEKNQGEIFKNLAGAVVKNNFVAVTENYGTVEVNELGAQVSFNNSGAEVSENKGWIQQNETGAKILKNTGLVYINYGYVQNAADGSTNGRVYLNYAHVDGGIVEQNSVFGTVSADTKVLCQLRAMFIESELAAMADNYEFEVFPDMDIDPDFGGAVGVPPSVAYMEHEGKYFYNIFPAPDDSYTIWSDKPLTVSPAGNCSFIDNGDGTYSVSNVSGNFTLSIAKSSVPDTGDVSNMPLWGALLLMFAATALLTRKKKA